MKKLIAVLLASMLSFGIAFADDAKKDDKKPAADKMEKKADKAADKMDKKADKAADKMDKKADKMDKKDDKK